MQHISAIFYQQVVSYKIYFVASKFAAISMWERNFVFLFIRRGAKVSGFQ
jgi:hypothetical protein